ncbi:MAG: hypothetical protein Q6363_003470 [Candidatus Njordarchaeota archaeon]
MGRHSRRIKNWFEINSLFIGIAIVIIVVIIGRMFAPNNTDPTLVSAVIVATSIILPMTYRKLTDARIGRGEHLLVIASISLAIALFFAGIWTATGVDSFASFSTGIALIGLSVLLGGIAISNANYIRRSKRYGRR